VPVGHRLSGGRRMESREPAHFPAVAPSPSPRHSS
jgi:hypothetical protein